MDGILRNAENYVILDKKEYWELEYRIKSLGEDIKELGAGIGELEEETKNEFEVPITEEDVIHSPWIQEIKDKVISQIDKETLQYSLIGLWDLCGNIDKFVKEKLKKERQRILDLVDDLKYNTPSSKHPDVNSIILKQKIIMEEEKTQTEEVSETEETPVDSEEEVSETEETPEEESKEGESEDEASEETTEEESETEESDEE